MCIKKWPLFTYLWCSSSIRTIWRTATMITRSSWAIRGTGPVSIRSCLSITSTIWGTSHQQGSEASLLQDRFSQWCKLHRCLQVHKWCSLRHKCSNLRWTLASLSSFHMHRWYLQLISSRRSLVRYLKCKCSHSHLLILPQEPQFNRKTSTHRCSD